MIRCCKSCAKKLESPGPRGDQGYIVTPEGGALNGVCQLCFTQTVTQIWEITPRRPRYARRSGGGERDRAGRRAR